MDRREFLKRSMLVAAGTFVGSSLLAKGSALTSFAEASKKSKKVGLQLYSLRDAIGKDVTGTLKKVSGMGYTTLETANYDNGKIYGCSPADFKVMCGDLGMKVTGSHLGQEYKKETDAQVMEWWKQALDAQAEVGCKTVVQPWFPIGKSLDDIKVYCDYFNKVGAMANERGLRFGFHNHAGEFAEVDGQVIFDYMVENTDPKDVMYELDVYWVGKGGKSPVDYINKYGNRIELLHIKDECAIGESGTIDFEPIFAAAYKNGIKDYFVEVERYTVSPDSDVARSFDFLNDAKYVK